MPRKKGVSSKKKKRSNVSKNTIKSVDNMKYEIASEFGVHLGPNATSRDNGLVGGEMTKRLVQKAKNSKKSSNNRSNNSK